ncbi:hypothetical protein Lser_V15G44532 [Lactuca serriola]
MAMHDANFSGQFDGGDKTNGFTDQKNMRLFEARRKSHKAIILSNSMNKPPALKKTSRKRKSLIPIGKAVGGYKKARKHQHRHCGLKKRSSEVNNKPFRSKTRTSKEEAEEEKEEAEAKAEEDEEEDESEEEDYDNLPTEEELDKYFMDFDYSTLTEFESENDRHKKFIEKFGPDIILRPSKEDLERKVAIPPDANLFVELDLCSRLEPGEPSWFRDYILEKRKNTGLYYQPTNEKLDELIGYKFEYTWSQKEFNRMFGYSELDSDSDSDSILKTPRR